MPKLSSTFSTADLNAVSSPASSSYQFAHNTLAARVVDAHLTAALSKPLHHFTEEELFGLIHELEQDEWLSREEDIASAVQLVYERWCSMRNVNATFAGSTVSVALPATRSTPSSSFSTISTISVRIPPSIPDEFAKPFIERIIRDQIEEG